MTLASKLALVILLGVSIGFGGFILIGKNQKPVQNKTPTPTTRQSPPATVTPAISYTYGAWISWWDESRALVSLEKQNAIHSISPFWYRLTDEGRLVEIITKTKQNVRDVAKQKNILITPTLVNEFVSDRVSALFDSPEKQQELMNLLIVDAQTYGYSGYDLDFEYLNQSEEKRLTNFIKTLGTTLKEKNLTFTVTVHAKQGTNKDWEKAKTYNWETIAPFVDALRIMAYDFHNSDSPPGAITPHDDLIAVIQYAIKQVPLSKITIALPNYGYDWGRSKAKPIVFSDISQLLPEDTTPIRDIHSDELYFTYIRETTHTVWYSDTLSVIAKVQKAKALGITSFMFWVLGGEDQKLWTNLP